MLFTELGNQEYGHTRTALAMLVHFAPMLLKLGSAYGGPT